MMKKLLLVLALLVFPSNTFAQLVIIRSPGGGGSVSTPISLADGGTGVVLVDPGADRILFWDDSAGVVDWLTVSGCSIAGTTLTCAGAGDVTGPAASIDSEVAVFNSTTGKIIKRATGTGPAILTAGVLSAAAINLATQVQSDLAFANLTQCAGLSALGVTGNSTADNGCITAGTDHQVLRRSGTTLSFGSINLSQAAAITGTLPVGNGGSGVATITGVLKGNGTSAFSAATAGTDYTTPSTEEIFTNKTTDCEATGNHCIYPVPVTLTTARCQAGIAYRAGDTFADADSATAVCGGGSNTAKAYVSFANDDEETWQSGFSLPSDYDATRAIDITLIWLSSSNSGNVRFYAALACSAVDDPDDPAFEDESTITDAAAVVANDISTASATNVDKSACTAGTNLKVRIRRVGAGTGDTLGAAALLKYVIVTYRRDM
jgi:hypothetical protein